MTSHDLKTKYLISKVSKTFNFEIHLPTREGKMVEGLRSRPQRVKKEKGVSHHQSKRPKKKKKKKSLAKEEGRKTGQAVLGYYFEGRGEDKSRRTDKGGFPFPKTIGKKP